MSDEVATPDGEEPSLLRRISARIHALSLELVRIARHGSEPGAKECSRLVTLDIQDMQVLRGIAVARLLAGRDNRGSARR